MKQYLLTVVCFFSIAAFSQNEVQNLANSFTTQENGCSVEPVIISCVHGGQAAAPGCSISCKENQIASCQQGETFAQTCKGLPARCRCD